MAYGVGSGPVGTFNENMIVPSGLFLMFAGPSIIEGHSIEFKKRKTVKNIFVIMFF